jgi:hypothetical protein
MTDYVQNMASSIEQKTEDDNSTPTDSQQRRTLKEEAKAALDAELRRKNEPSN